MRQSEQELSVLMAECARDPLRFVEAGFLR